MIDTLKVTVAEKKGDRVYHVKPQDVDVRGGTDVGRVPGDPELSFDGGTTWIAASNLKALLEEAIVLDKKAAEGNT